MSFCCEGASQVLPKLGSNSPLQPPQTRYSTVITGWLPYSTPPPFSPSPFPFSELSSSSSSIIVPTLLSSLLHSMKP
ncbi:hypothetical protein TorRG33x02_237790 [Trema orientale]|uniref:Uncharacterized protein n=1 Tax=Trema orientale TaxID=63057 RepID=A0A2P5DYT6_TREOI|nr:hypothetical protein TorRG33x02_237790 [Trema orientale]